MMSMNSAPTPEHKPWNGTLGTGSFSVMMFRADAKKKGFTKFFGEGVGARSQ